MMKEQTRLLLKVRYNQHQVTESSNLAWTSRGINVWKLSKCFILNLLKIFLNHSLQIIDQETYHAKQSDYQIVMISC